VEGALLLAQAAWRAWMADHGGSIVNVVSTGGIRPAPFIGAYNTRSYVGWPGEDDPYVPADPTQPTSVLIVCHGFGCAYRNPFVLTPARVAMLRAMLADRFRLVTHAETREAPAYALVLARKDERLGPQLRHAEEDCGASPAVKPSPDDGHPCELQIGGEIRGRGQRMDQLAKTLLQFVGRSIVDRTGLTGGFDFDIQASEIAGGDDLPSIYTAIQEQLGLKLEPIRAPVEFVVVDHIDHPEPN